MDLEKYGIFIDTQGAAEEAEEEEQNDENSSKEDDDTSDTIIKRLLKEYREEKEKERILAGENVPEKPKSIFEKFYEDMGWHGPVPDKKDSYLSRKRKVKEVIETRKDLVENKKAIDEVLRKSKVLKPEFNEAHSLPAYDVSERIAKRERKKEREKTKGKMWYNLPATEVTEEVKKDLEILKMRSVLDPKHFYKKNDIKVLPKYFQIGTVQDSHLEYHNRLTKKDRKKTLVDELMANAEFERYNKKKYAEIVTEKQKTHYSAYKKARKLKKKGK